MKYETKEVQYKIDYSIFPFPKPVSKKKPARSYKQVQKRGYCAVCGSKGRTVWHHIVFRSQGGDESPCNLLEVGDDFLCSCHRNIHAGLISSDRFLQR